MSPVFTKRFLDIRGFYIFVLTYLGIPVRSFTLSIPIETILKVWGILQFIAVQSYTKPMAIEHRGMFPHNML